MVPSNLIFLSKVLQDAIDSVKLNRNIPLQRQKTAEISFVLKAIATVIASMKKASASSPSVSKKTWNQVRPKSLNYDNENAWVLAEF